MSDGASVQHIVTQAATFHGVWGNLNSHNYALDFSHNQSRNNYLVGKHNLDYTADGQNPPTLQLALLLFGFLKKFCYCCEPLPTTVPKFSCAVALFLHGVLFLGAAILDCTTYCNSLARPCGILVRPQHLVRSQK